jgi:DNA polymerase-1
MLEAYQRAESDLHAETQRRIFGDPSKMDKETQKKTRTLSKNINFGLVFGGGHGTLIKFAAKMGVEIGEEEALEYKEAFRQTYPGLYRWQRLQGNVKPNSVTTIKGRRRFIESGKAYCTRINHIVQGSAADGMKSAMVRVHKAGILPLVNVHDEILVEVAEEDAQWTADTLVKCMVAGMYSATEMNPDNPVVPIIAEVDIGNSWADKS